MKITAVVACISLISLNAFAFDLVSKDQHEKIRKALIRTVKAQYDSWLIHGSNPEETEMPPGDDQDGLIVAASELKPETSKNQEHIFSEFTFKIGQGQAIVRFTVDQKTVSAFFEHKDDHWQLVCAAFIPPAL